MTTYFGRAWRILMMDPGELRQHLSEPNAMAVSLSLAVVAGLIAGLGELTGVGADLTQPSAAERAQQSASAMAAIPGSLPEGIAGIVEPITSEVSMVLTNLSTALESVEPPLGAQTSQVLRSFGAWLSTPFNMLAGLMVVTLPMVLVARWLGGTGTLRNQVSLLLLALLPQALTVLDSFPVAGTLASLAWILGVLALVWSAVILLRGLAVANGVTMGRAIGIVAVAIGVFFVLAPVVVAALTSVLTAIVLRALT